MVTFIAVVVTTVISVTGAFEQGQANPNASNFFDSQNTVVEKEVFIVDTL